MTTLEPLSGSPEAVRLIAARVRATGERLAAVSGTLARLRSGAVWDGPAGEAFGARVGAVPAVLDAAARRHLGATAPLLALADVLEDAQAVTTAAQREHSEAQEWYARLEDHAWTLVSAGVPESDPRLLAVRARQREHAATAARSRARHENAVGRFRDADRRCARALRDLAADGLADPWTYRALRSASDVGHGVGYVGTLGAAVPGARALGLLGDTAGWVADGTLLVGFGEGSWSDMAVAAGASVTGFTGRGLVRGAGAGARIGEDGVEVFRRLSTRERVVAGAVAQARHRAAAVRSSFEVPPPRGTPSALIGGPPVTAPPGGSLAERVRRAAVTARARAAATVDARLLDDWRLASANGTRPMYASGMTLRAASAAGDKATYRRKDDP